MSAPVVVAVARDPAEAQIWCDALRQDGIEAGTYERGPGAAFGGLATVVSDYPVLVSPTRIGDARNVIAELGGAPFLSPIDTGEDGDPGQIKRSWMFLPGLLILAMVVFLFVLNAIAS